MKFILHIGTEKTGTTTIQSVIHDNRDALLAKGYYVPHSPGLRNQRTLPAYCMRDDRSDKFTREKGLESPTTRQDFKQQVREAFHKELQTLPPHVHTVLISSEHFHSRIRHDDELQALSDLLRPFAKTISILVYLRPQVDTALSRYSTSLRAGNTRDLETYVHHACTPHLPTYNYEIFLNLWATHFGHDCMRVRLFTKKEFINGDLIDDFFSQIDADLFSSLQTHLPPQNESVNHLGQVLMRAINMHIPRHNDKHEVNRLNVSLVRDIAERAKGKSLSLSPTQLKDAQSIFDQCNEAVRETYFAHRSSLFEPTHTVSEHRMLNDRQTRLIEDAVAAVTGHNNQLPETGQALLKRLRNEVARDDAELAKKLQELAEDTPPHSAGKLGLLSKLKDKVMKPR